MEYDAWLALGLVFQIVWWYNGPLAENADTLVSKDQFHKEDFIYWKKEETVISGMKCLLAYLSVWYRKVYVLRLHQMIKCYTNIVVESFMEPILHI